MDTLDVGDGGADGAGVDSAEEGRGDVERAESAEENKIM